MNVRLACPRCRAALSLPPNSICSLIRCRHCKHWFRPVMDAEVPCPECQSVIIVPEGKLPKEVMCYSCGLILKKSKIPRAWYVIAASALVMVLSIVMMALGADDKPGVYEQLEMEAWARSAVRAIERAQEIYSVHAGEYGALEDLCKAGLINAILAETTSKWKARKGYYVNLVVEQGETWVLEVKPVDKSLDLPEFYRDSTGISVVAW